MYTEKAKRLFLETGHRFQRRIIWAMGLLKYACAEANVELGALDKRVGEAVAAAADEVAAGIHDAEIEVDVFQTGSGTGLNMNVNEVIARAASGRLGAPIHPNDHVNKSQSSNDVVSSAVRIAAVAEAELSLSPALEGLAAALGESAERHWGVIKAGRTHLRDALPVTLGQELDAYAHAFARDSEVLEAALERVKELPIGGTAVGTGSNAPPGFGERVLYIVNERTGMGFKRGNPLTQMRLLTDLLTLSAVLRSVAVDLYRLGQDIRLMYSGPFAGLGEVDLPGQGEIAGSSIMPGKTNPVTVEAAMLAAAQVVGLDHANQMASMYGEFELAMGIPLVGYNVVEQIKLLSEASRKMSMVVGDIRPNAERMRRQAESSPAIAAVLAERLGYDAAAKIAREIAAGAPAADTLRRLGYEVDLEELAGLRRRANR